MTSNSDYDGLKESVASKAEFAAKNLDKVHSYLFDAFEFDWDVVLHKAQYGEKEFNYEALPDVPLKKIFQCLSPKDLKNMRGVSKRLAELVLELRPKMRTWSVDLDLQTQEVSTFLNNLSTKGITRMRNFKLQFKNVKNEASVDLVREWQHHIYHLEISPLASYQFHAKNLESLVILDAGDAENISGNGVVMNELVNAHRSSLKRLTVFPTDCMNGDAHVYRELPHMKSMLINGNASKDILRSLFSNPSKHITVLSLSQHVNVKGINSSHLKLPQLKQLKVIGPDNLPLLCANAAQIEILTVQTSSVQPWFDDIGNEALFDANSDFPEYLPKLKMLSFEYGHPGSMTILSKLLL